MPTLAQLRTRVYAYLGTPTTDTNFPPAKLDVWINDAKNDLEADLPKDYTVLRATITPDGGAGRVYTLTSQSPAITGVRSVLLLRLDDDEGTILHLRRWDELGKWDGSVYALTGPDDNLVIEVGPTVEADHDLYLVYTAWSTEIANDIDVPTALPARFHDLIALKAAKLAFASGNEQHWPAEYEDQMERRTTQFYQHIGTRTTAPALQRVAEEES